MERGPLTVAVIEDDTSMLRSVQRLLKAYGFAVEGFATAEAFLERLFERDFACAVVDIHLPGMTGSELSGELAASGNGLPLIFITAAEDESLEHLTSCDACIALLRKPFPPASLLGAVEAALSSR